VEFEIKLTELQSKNDQLQRELGSTTEHHQFELERKDSENRIRLAKSRKLEAEIDGLRSQNSKLADELSVAKAQSAELKAKVSERQESNKTNTVLAVQLRASEAAAESAIAKNHKLSRETERIRENLNFIENQLRQAQLERDGLKEKCEMMVSQLRADKSSFHQSKTAFAELESQVTRAEEALKLTEATLSNQREEIQSFSDDREKLLGALHKLSEMVDVLEGNYSKLHAQQSTVSELECQNVEQIPPNSWIAAEFPRELRRSIGELIQPDEPLQSKLKKVLATIGSFYNAELRGQAELNHNYSKELNEFTAGWKSSLRS
jgi:chromosome segregation ATPase